MNTKTNATTTLSVATKMRNHVTKTPTSIEYKLLQTTLTQLAKDNPINSNSNFKSNDNFVVKHGPVKEVSSTEIKKAMKKSKTGALIHYWHLTSLVEGMNYDVTQLGNVIMGRAGDLNHPVFLKYQVSINFYILSVMRWFCSIRNELRYIRKIDYGDEYCNERLEMKWTK